MAAKLPAWPPPTLIVKLVMGKDAMVVRGACWRNSCENPCRNKLNPDFRHRRTKEAAWMKDGSSADAVKVVSEEEASDKVGCWAGDGQRFNWTAQLKACRNLESVKDVHARMMEQCGREFPVYVTNALMDMYVRYGSMVDAGAVFDSISLGNVVSWTVMICGYANKGKGELALELYARMQQEGVVPNERTFVGALKACSSLASQEDGSGTDGMVGKGRYLAKGRAIHSLVLKSGYEANVFVGTTLVDMYVKCGSMVDARQVFDMLPYRDVVSWNAMIVGYAQKEEGELALELYARMQQEGVAPDHRTFVGALKACSGLATLEEGTEVSGSVLKVAHLGKGRAIHSRAVESGYESDVFVGNILVDMYAKCGSMVDAQQVFDKLPGRNVVSWSAMILGYAHNKECEMAVELYAQMLQEGVLPTSQTFVGVLKACCILAILEEGIEINETVMKMRSLQRGRAIHSQVVKSGCESQVFVGTMLVDMYAKCGSMADARHVFDKLPRHDVVCWNVMIMGYAEQGGSEEAFRLYALMREEGLSPSCATFVSILKACGNMASLDMGKDIHAEIRLVGLETSNTIVATALVDMYGRCGSMVDAQQVFEALPSRNLVTWNVLMAGYARQGKSEIVFHLFERIRQEGIQPNAITFLSVLTVCSHVGLVDKGQKYFNAMSKDYGLTPTVEHYTCMVDLFGRAGRVDEALAIVEGMPFQSNIVMWRTLLGACRKWSKVEVGRRAFEHALSLDMNSAAAYVLMSNIYADAHMWKERDEIQAMRENARAWKKPGKSWWTAKNGVVRTFVAGSKKYPQRRQILARLKKLSVRMKEEGYVPDFDSVLRDISDDEKEDWLCGHSEKLAIACALINTSPGTTVRIAKNLRVCDDCHHAIALISKIEARQIICRDASQFHVYNDGKCSCGNYW